MYVYFNIFNTYESQIVLIVEWGFFYFYNKANSYVYYNLSQYVILLIRILTLSLVLFVRRINRNNKYINNVYIRIVKNLSQNLSD